MATFTKRGDYWRAQIRRTGHPTQDQSFDTKDQCVRWARDIESRMDRGLFCDNREAEQTTLHEALDRYYREIGSLKAHPAQELQRVKQWQRHPLAKRYLATLRGSDFAKYRDQRRAVGKAENTIRLELTIIGHLFVIGRKEWGMEALINPIANIRKPGGSQHRDRRLKAGEYDTLLANFRESDNPYLAPAFILAIETSLRQGMLFKLRWEWVDYDKAVISIPTTLRQVGNKGVPAGVPLSKAALSELRRMPRALSGLILDCSVNAVRILWNRRLKDLNITGLRWHDLRHEAASRFFEKGLELMSVASITAHKNPAMLRRYVHLEPAALAVMLG